MLPPSEIIMPPLERVPPSEGFALPPVRHGW